MTPEKLADLIDQYGSAVGTWPNPEQRTAAEALLRSSQAARTVLRRARGLERCLRPHEDSLIDRAAESTGSELLIARILEQARRTPQAPPPLAVRLRERWLLLLEAASGSWLSYGLPAVPAPKALTIEIPPPCNSSRALTSDKPSPVPPAPRV